MPSASPPVEDMCPTCNKSILGAHRSCPSCQSDLGFPNVRNATKSDNLESLKQRYSCRTKEINEAGLKEELEDIELKVQTDSSVVVSIPASIARSLLEDPKVNYVNYESLVGAGIRQPAEQRNDRHRIAVAGMLFGSFFNKILYGALSLTGSGLATYGDVFCKLKSISIKSRTTFLECNSYVFVEKHEIAAGESIPTGHSCCWDDRSKLVIAKLGGKIKKKTTHEEFQGILLKSDGVHRENDDFIEAHIYDSFNSGAIESIELKDTRNSPITVQIDAMLAAEVFKQNAK